MNKDDDDVMVDSNTDFTNHAPIITNKEDVIPSLVNTKTDLSFHESSNSSTSIQGSPK
jgi:hypothetical protein